MHIVEQSDKRLVLRQRRLGMGVVMSVFSVLSGLTLLNILLQGIQRWSQLSGWQLFSWLIWLGFLSLLLVVGVLSASTMLQGVTCTLDREHETAAIRRPRWLRIVQQTVPIYSVSHLAVEQNPEVRVFGVFLVLRSGERIALATVPPHDQEPMDRTARAVKRFLLQPFTVEA